MPQDFGIRKTPVPEQVTRAIQDQLSFRREEIRGQLKELTNRRNELSEQRSGASAQGARDLDGRIAAIDQRSAKLEGQLFAVNDQITRGVVPELVSSFKISQAGQTVPPPFDPDFLQSQTRQAAREGVFSSAFGMFAIFLAYRGIRRLMGKTRDPVIVDNSAQLIQLQQSMDVIALEVERISEAQRYTAKLLSEKGEKAPSLRA